MIILWWILGILGFILALVAVLAFAPLRARATLKDGEISAEIKILGMHFAKQMPAEKVVKLTEKKAEKEVKEETQDDNTSISEKIYDVKRKIYAVRVVMEQLTKYLSKRLIFESLTIKLRFGDGNPPTTAIETGLIWGAIGGLTAVLNNYFIVETPIDADVLPEFNQKMLDLYISGIIRTRLAHIIIAAFKGVKIYDKIEKP